jgi:hypothetical protein
MTVLHVKSIRNLATVAGTYYPQLTIHPRTRIKPALHRHSTGHEANELETLSKDLLSG